jgi:hypothetical protein
VRYIASRAGRERSFRRPSSRAEDWRLPVDGRAPRLGPRQYIGEDIAPGHGAWAGRDPMHTPRWWRGTSWSALIWWVLMAAGGGWLSWRRHGGKAYLLGRDGE